MEGKDLMEAPKPASAASDSSPKMVVVLDTNAYRCLCQGRTHAESMARAAELRAAEVQAGILPLAHFTVIKELVAHLEDVADPAYAVCRNALCAMVAHTWDRSGGEAGISAIADFETTLLASILGEDGVTAAHRHYHQVVSALAAHIAKHTPGALSEEATGQISLLAWIVERSENEWVLAMREMVQKYSPGEEWILAGEDKNVQRKARRYFGSEQFRRNMALALGIMAVEINGGDAGSHRLDELSSSLYERFGVGLRLLATILQKMATPDGFRLDRRNRANLYWDFQVCFAVGPSHEIDGARVSVVTEDSDIRLPAEAEGCGDLILTPAAYGDLLGLPFWQASIKGTEASGRSLS